MVNTFFTVAYLSSASPMQWSKLLVKKNDFYEPQCVSSTYVDPKPFKPSRCIKASFRISEKWPKLFKIWDCKPISFMELVNNTTIFFHLSPTSSGCSEWRWQW